MNDEKKRFIQLINKNLPIEQMKKQKILITGATGLIGSVLTQFLLVLNEQYRLEMRLLLLVRDKSKLDEKILKQVDSDSVKIVQGDVLEFPEISEEIDYIIHGASITVSKMMVDNPVEVIKTNVYGTCNMLEVARKNRIKAMVFLSTMEVYGFIEDEVLLKEDSMQYLNPLAIRSSYPESKRMAENLCVSYAKEYQVPVKIVRLAQTFGKGVKQDDTRVFAEFARCAKNSKNIQLMTDGKSKRMYLDTVDAAQAILMVLFKGNVGEAYNVANKETYCSIYEMAEFVASEISRGNILVQFVKGQGVNNQFSPPHKLLLDTTKIEGLGWQPTTDLKTMYINMIESWQ